MDTGVSRHPILESHRLRDKVRRWIFEDDQNAGTACALPSHESGFISTLYTACYDLFCVLQLVENHKEVPPRSWADPVADCFGRFYLWSQGLDFVQLEASSYAAQDIRNKVIVLLCRVAKTQLLCMLVRADSNCGLN
jgi:hypothetical protein